jgi:hypothetical protein
MPKYLYIQLHAHGAGAVTPAPLKIRADKIIKEGNKTSIKLGAELVGRVRYEHDSRMVNRGRVVLTPRSWDGGL